MVEMYCELVYEKWAMANCLKKYVLVGFLVVFLSSASVDSDDGAILLEVKKSFRDVDNVLYDWTDTPSSDYCVWRGITCDNVTFNVVALNLSGLNLDGEISPAFGQLKGLVSIDLRGNRLSGQIPDEIGDCSALESLDLSFNELYGDIPFSLSKLKQLETLILKNNKLIGPIPSTLSQIPNLKILDLAQNKLSGEIPRLLYWNEVLQYLGLRGNNLQGTLSPDMCQLTGLWYFDVRNNSLSGSIPDNIGNCTAFQVLSLQNNRFSGQIPSVIGLMQALAVLNVANNHLEGPIPDNLSSCTNLNSLNVHGNKLNGTVPLAFQKLESMTYLNLSSNNLQGPIPIELSRIGNLDTLDLSNNRLSGPIPQELGQLQNVFLLNVSYNNLVGYIPTGNNFSRFSPDSFIGNPGLCGYWLGSSCHQPRPAERVSISKAAILGIALGALVILLMILIAACRPHNPKSIMDGTLEKPVTYSSPKLVILHMNMALHVYEDIMRMTENLSEKYIIGYGASSTVYKCILKNCRPVAIKKLFSHYPQCLKEFETELETVGSIKHRNLVGLQGYSLSQSGNLLFYDYMENGSLWDLLHGTTKKKKLDWETRLRIALGAAQGLAYLHHDCSPRIIHRDVKSSNILLDKDYEAHLTDFGIAKSLCTSKTHTSTYLMGTIGYIDPEYARTSRLTEKSDVYSYGIVLLELLTGRKPVDNESNLHHLILTKAANNSVMDTVDPEISETCKDLGEVKKVFQLALLCTKKQPLDRPTMHEVVRVLGTLIPPPEAKTFAPILPAPLPSSKVQCYVDEYANLKTPHLVNCSSMSTSDAQLFLKFGEVISQNSVS
ncbi:UNVERIFIED_CONTAM: LRR receptor-like serine/threonine-protein kinase ERECTA [Sesamum radiatum]|uniref:non-specific serine/threonine protein kinase n=1 Tax=Sesamum radiatum TaxID=300843 RepID=A0AAW2TT29_SESRA